MKNCFELKNDINILIFISEMKDFRYFSFASWNSRNELGTGSFETKLLNVWRHCDLE